MNGSKVFPLSRPGTDVPAGPIPVRMSYAQYARFLVVGTVVAAVGIGVRELIGRILVTDTVVHYSISVLAAYAVGIVLSFRLNRNFTFAADAASHSWAKFMIFVAIACGGLVSTGLLSVAIRYGIHLDRFAGSFSGAIAFATASLLSSAITYPLNALLVFRKHRSANNPEAAIS